MSMSSRAWPLVVAVALAAAGGARAGALGPGIAADEPAAKAGPAGTQLKVQVTFTRYQGERKVSSMPYTLSVYADDRPTVVRAGIQVPIVVSQGPDKGPTVMYKDVGNNLDCSAHTLADGRFKLAFSLELGSVHPADAVPRAPGETVSFPAPVLRTFRSQTAVLLRDGQSTQYVAATDPVNGDLLKIDVTLNVVK
jgi:Flp pilus assembly secretin CpaC